MAHWPQWLTAVWLGLMIPGHAYGAAKKATGYEGAVHFLVGVLRWAVGIGVLYAGGFFAPIGWGGGA